MIDAIKQRVHKKSGCIMMQVVTILFIILIVITRLLGNMDELWLYSYGSNVARGMQIYKDINYCGTPLAVYILAIMFKLFGHELYIYRIASILVYSITYLLVSKKTSEKTEDAMWLQPILSLYFLVMYQSMIFEYNILNIVFLLLVIRLEEKEHTTKKHLFAIGTIIGLIVLTKQTTGAASILCCIWISLVKKQNIKEILIKASGAALVGAVFLIYICTNGSFMDMLEFTLLGAGNFIKNFDSRFLIIALFTCGFVIVPLIIYYIFKCINTIKQGKQDTAYITLIYMLASFAIIIPIIDKTHIMTALIPMLPLTLSDLYKKQHVLKSSYVVMLTASVLITGMVITIVDSPDSRSEHKHYRFIPISSEMEEYLDKCMEMINMYRDSGKEVYILDYSAVLAFIPEDVFHKYYDIMLNGNLGTMTAEQAVKEICKQDNVIMIPEEKYMHYQMPDNLHMYLEENGMKATEELYHLQIYTLGE